MSYFSYFGHSILPKRCYDVYVLRHTTSQHFTSYLKGRYFGGLIQNHQNPPIFLVTKNIFFGSAKIFLNRHFFFQKGLKSLKARISALLSITIFLYSQIKFLSNLFFLFSIRQNSATLRRNWRISVSAKISSFKMSG